MEVRVLSAALFLLHLFMWLLLFLCLVKPALAQDSSDLYTQYRTDYFYQRDLYQKDYLDYLNKKDVYSQYGSLTAQNDKLNATKNVFLSQNLMLKTYLMALRTTLSESSDQQIEIQKLENWLSTQNELIPNLNNETAIKNWANTFRIQYIPIQTAIYTGLVQTQINQRTKLLLEIKKLAQTTKTNWSSDFSQKESQINQSFQLALEACRQNQREDQFSEFYPDAKENLDQADLYLKSLLSDLKSTVIKNN